MSASQITQRREETWLAAMDEGWTTARIAKLAGVSARYVRRLVARARQARDRDSAEPTSSLATTTPIPTACELPRLVLTDTETLGPTRTDSPTCGLRYALATDAVSLDGGSTWIAPDDPSTPRMSVLASDRNGCGLRKHRLEPRPHQTPPEPPGPTSYRPSKALKGGRG
jgi:hypothetical protein